MSSYQFTSAEFVQQLIGPSPDRSTAEPIQFAGLDSRYEWALLGESIAVRRLRSQIRRIAPYFRTALIRGEQGAGNHAVARAIHALSTVADMPFIVADACALTKSLDPSPHSDLTSSSTAAEVFESARGGTVYITRIGELSPDRQAALFRFFQNFEADRNGTLSLSNGQIEARGLTAYDRSGSTHTRILASSSRDLRTLSAIGQFRKDLYGRLSVLQIYVPPLRERIDDIPTLVERLLRRLAEERWQSPPALAESAKLRLQQHSWPDNLRELKCVITHAAALTEGGAIEARHLLSLIEPSATRSTELRSDRLHDVVQRHVLQVLMHCEGNKVRAAELLGISRSTLYRMLGVKPDRDAQHVQIRVKV